MSSFASRDNVDFIERLYQQFKANPESVNIDWRKFFEGMEFGQDNNFGLSDKELHVYELISAYRDYGHMEADVDPLANSPSSSDQVSLARYNLSDKDLDSHFQVGAMIGKPNATLRDIISHLRSCYCGTLTVQCSESLPDVRNWFIQEFEQKKSEFKLSAEQKKEIFHSLTRAESLEKFIHTRYVGTKRFSVEGADALLPMLEWLVSKSTQLSGKEIMIGMAHRGRVNVLANFMGKALEYIFADFNGPTATTEPIDDFDGDVKYHLGYHAEKQTANGPCKVTLAFNPSHLEAVNPVVMGMTRAAQRRHHDTADRQRAIPVLIHGDAAFAGQGVVAETFQMAYVKGYTVGGTLHIAIDNQIGFTTNPEFSRSSHYCTDISKVIGAPVLHCNGDDVEACVRAMDIAIRFRQQWGRDVVINIVCYRRFGHNESDEPAYTQPLMYDLIRKHPTLREIYGKQLIRESYIDQAHFDGLYNEKINNLQKIFDDTKANPPKIEPVKFEGFWKGLRKGKLDDFEKPTDTTCKKSLIQDLCKLIGEVPANFTPHPKLEKLLASRKAMGTGKEPFDWGAAELMAYGSLAAEGSSVRLSGQDCVRGTFTHRHSALYDIKTGEAYNAIKTFAEKQGKEFCVYDSVLSEYGVLGFEYGNAICDPTFLTIWEAQFGDFANGAQIIIDQFISSGESKWQQMCGLVLLLPHGYEGQGPEHSSARLERFLQLCANANIQVCNLTTPAQIFHALRRQMKRPFRKPMVIMSPKSLLRHPRATSTLDELVGGSFHEVIADASVKDPKKVETMALCSGKIYYDLLEEKEKSKHERTALVRLEQIYPTPFSQLAQVIKSYPNLKNLVWVQEEPKNMGAYQHIYFKLSEFLMKEKLTHLKFNYVGRGERSSPATGSLYRHRVEQAEIVRSLYEI